MAAYVGTIGLCVGGLGVLGSAADELSESGSEVTHSPRVQRRVPDRVEMRQYDADADEMTGHVTVGTEVEQRVDGVQRQP